MTVFLILVSPLQRVSRSFYLPLNKFVNTVHNSDPRYGLILKQRLNLNFDAVSSVSIANFNVRDWQNRTLLWIHPFMRVPTWSRGNEYSLHKDRLSYPLGDGRAQKSCPTSTNHKPASEHSLDNFWSSDNFSNRCSYSCSKFTCRSSMACTSARGCCVISTLSSWPDATGFPGALWPTANSSIMSATAPLKLGWLTEMTIWRSNSMFCVLPLKCIDVFPPPLLLYSPLSKAVVQRNIGWPVPAKFCSIFCAVRFQNPSGFQS